MLFKALKELEINVSLYVHQRRKGVKGVVWREGVRWPLPAIEEVFHKDFELDDDPIEMEKIPYVEDILTFQQLHFINQFIDILTKTSYLTRIRIFNENFFKEFYVSVKTTVAIFF